ncbi:hypothetical protein [Citreimonas salinaria]|uniref:Uncharacterized protein n=1 Tax=Citreimonas salinaria TaxID=321339 RepID=A0A1H3JQD2_9RHOB|nr:hypothetical protein [Citreimonas salinaria]SDY41755.1 hypothetical protein SAMN05444340_107162 [Citreimonas salinaria]
MCIAIIFGAFLLSASSLYLIYFRTLVALSLPGNLAAFADAELAAGKFFFLTMSVAVSLFFANYFLYYFTSMALMLTSLKVSLKLNHRVARNTSIVVRKSVRFAKHRKPFFLFILSALVFSFIEYRSNFFYFLCYILVNAISATTLSAFFHFRISNLGDIFRNFAHLDFSLPSSIAKASGTRKLSALLVGFALFFGGFSIIAATFDADGIFSGNQAEVTFTDGTVVTAWISAPLSRGVVVIHKIKKGLVLTSAEEGSFIPYESIKIIAFPDEP